jgi:hypothetical protein
VPPRLQLLASADDALVCTDDLCLPAGFDAALVPAPAPAAAPAPATADAAARRPEEPAR